jgi:gliding motility-associated-like protein/uncharacterized repeat protein (TIGR01451 family)
MKHFFKINFRYMYLIINQLLKEIKKVSYLICVLGIMMSTSVFAQTWPADTIHVNINTGNPAFPFPQFLEYKAGKSLAANNAVGVTHADMEKGMREAYQIMMHRAIYNGQTYNGVRYIKFNPLVVPANPGGYFCSEGDGYALLAAAYFADKATFDGLWMWIHDNRLSNVKQYYNCADLRANYRFGGGMAGWNNDATTTVDQGINDAAADGDFDIAMALVIAGKQWPAGMGINDACGNAISYKTEALKMVKVLVDTLYYSQNYKGDAAGTKGYLTGDIGIDGYIKSGNTWRELTAWKSSAANTLYPWANAIPDVTGRISVYVDYNAPAYFREFVTFLEENSGSTNWQISQYKRAEASGDWTIKQMYDKGYIASAGTYTVSDNGAATTFTSFSAGEDFRCSWRTILNYVWHGNPDSTWDPVTHQVVLGGNTFEYDMALRHKEFLKFPNSLPSTSVNAFCSKLGASPDPGQPLWKGVAQIKQQYAPNGSVLAAYDVNWMAGTGMPAAVASGDLDLTAELYRQCELVWDDQSGLQTLPTYQRYIGSTPTYFHGWFRTLGMLTGSGNLHAPDKMVAAANVKVYMAVDKTFAYEGDLVNYQVSYRNYGSVDATGVNITTTIDPNYTIVSASNGGIMSGNTITWNIGTITGFKTNGLAATMGTRTFVVKVNPIATATVACLVSTITASNAPSWTSNEYPNNASYTMERNCVDLLKDRVLAIQKTTDRSVMNSGDIVNFTLNFQNKTGSNLWLDGGRDRVLLSYANYHAPSGTSFYQFYRIWHTAQEAYINLNNYRVSYFMNDAAAIGKYDAVTNPTGWDTYVDNQNDLNKYGYNPTTYPDGSAVPANKQLNFTYQKIPWGSDANGAWNQRVITQFADVLSAASTHVFDKLDEQYLNHKGVVGPGFTRTRFESKPSSDLGPRIADDWSYDPIAASGSLDGQGYYFFPVTPSYTNATTIPRFAPVLVNNYSKDACGGPVQNFAKVLFEEFDGYTWRRIAGNGPLPGRETYNVIVTDSIPIQLSWNGFTNAVTIGVTATYTALPANPKFSGYVKWTIPVMLTGDIGKLTYRTIAKSPCVEKTFINAGWIWSDVDSPDSAAVHLKLTCNPVPPTPPIETSLVKTADKSSAVVGDVVTYTLTYTNKDGSTASWAGASTLATDWQTLGTGVTIPKLNGTVISLDQNGGNNAPGANGYSFGPKKAHGVNGWVEATIAATNSSNVSFLYRYQSPTQNITLEVSPNIGGNNNIAFYLYINGSATPFVSLTGLAFPGSSSAIKIRTQLVDDKLYIWVNDFTGAPLKVIAGITQLGAGFTGIYGNGSQQALSAYTAHFDSAFDLFISDPVPIQLNNVVNISNTGILTGSTVAWPTIPGPILANVVTTRTFQATVNTCTDFITNIGNATVYGISYIQSQYVITCGGTPPIPCVPPTVVTATVTNTSICLGSALSISGSASPANMHYYYTWFKDGVAVTTPSKTYAPFTKAVTTAADAGTYKLRVEYGNAGTVSCYKESSNIIITINALPIAGSVSADQTICLGATPIALTGTASTGGVTVKNYKWQSSTINGTTGPWTQVAAYSTTGTGFTPGAISGDTWFRRIDSSGVCAGIATNSIKITTNALPIAGSISSYQTICLGATPVALTGTVSTGGVTVKNYKWQISTVNGTTGPWTQVAAYSTIGTGFTPAAISADTWFRRIDSSGVCAGIATNSIKIAITPLVTPSILIATPATTVCSGASITFTATPTNGGTTPMYQWFKGTAPTGTSLGIASTNATYTTTTAADNDSYYAVMTSTALCASPLTATSNAIVITVTTGVTPAVSITALPVGAICAGTNVTFTAVAGNGGTAPMYQWKINGVNEGSAATSATFTPTTLANGDLVSVLMTSNSSCVAAPGTASSNIITMVVNPLVVPSVTIATPSTTICTGISVTFTATPTNGGTTPGYQWYKGAVGSGSAISAETNATYTTTLAANNDSYYVIMTSTESCPSPKTVTSNAVVITVTTVVTAGVSITASPAGAICAGKSVTFTASPGNGGTTPKYEWFVNATSQGTASSAAGSNKFTSTALLDGDKVSVIMTSNSGCVLAPGTATSNVITMVVNPNVTPTVTLTADKSTICPGDLVNYTATSTNGGTPTYTWSGTPTAAGTGATYSTSGLTSPNSVTVTVNSTETCVTSATATSTPIVVTVTPVPTITVSITPTTGNICSGNAVSFTAVASGTGSTPPPTYEWFVSSSTTPGPPASSQGTPSTTATSFATSALTPALPAGTDMNKVYVQVVSNATCASKIPVVSNVATITVNPGVDPGTIEKGQTICYNTQPADLTELTAAKNITAASSTYTWESSGDGITGWTPVAGSGTGYTFPGKITLGIYLHRIVTDASIAGTCKSATTPPVHIQVLPALVAGVIGSDEPGICSGSVPKTMTETTAPTGGTGTYTYQWQTDASGTMTNIPGETNSSYSSGAITATTKFQLIETSGTCGSVTSNIVTKTISAQENIIAGITDPGAICASTTATTFTATGTTDGSGTLSYAWTLGGTAVGTNSTTYSYTPVIGDNGKEVKVVVSTTNTCNSGNNKTASFTLNVINAVAPSVTISTPYNPICEGYPINFVATATDAGTSPTYQWYVVPSSGTAQQVGTNAASYMSTPLVTGDQVYVEVTSSLSCALLPNPATSNKITMTVLPVPKPSIVEQNDTLCVPGTPSSKVFRVVPTSTGNTVQWYHNGSPIAGATSFTYTASNAGTYSVQESNAACNAISSSRTLTLIPKPIANAGPDVYLPEGAVSALDGSGGAIYSWTPATYLSSVTVSNPIYKATKTITYELTVTDATGKCKSTDDVTVYVVKPITVPNVITVNGDGVNDTWEIENIHGYPHSIIEIYNRWGNLVWKAEGYPKNWDGTNFRNGEVLPDGTYFYIIHLHSDVYPEPKTGWIQIIK